MDLEQALETQRHRLLRIIAGLVVLVGFLAVGPVSRGFSAWTLGFVGSILSRAEAAARYLLITQACLMLDRSGLRVERCRIAASIDPVWITDEADISLTSCQKRVKALRTLLSDLPRHALRLLRRIAKGKRRSANPRSASFILCASAPLSDGQRAVARIERPPDKDASTPYLISPPPESRREALAVEPQFLTESITERPCNTRAVQCIFAAKAPRALGNVSRKRL